LLDFSRLNEKLPNYCYTEDNYEAGIAIGHLIGSHALYSELRDIVEWMDVNDERLSNTIFGTYILVKASKGYRIDLIKLQSGHFIDGKFRYFVGLNKATSWRKIEL
jgi:hypothetical protein